MKYNREQIQKNYKSSGTCNKKLLDTFFEDTEGIFFRHFTAGILLLFMFAGCSIIAKHTINTYNIEYTKCSGEVFQKQVQCESLYKLTISTIDRAVPILTCGKTIDWNVCGFKLLKNN